MRTGGVADGIGEERARGARADNRDGDVGRRHDRDDDRTSVPFPHPSSTNITDTHCNGTPTPPTKFEHGTSQDTLGAHPIELPLQINLIHTSIHTLKVTNWRKGPARARRAAADFLDGTEVAKTKRADRTVQPNEPGAFQHSSEVTNIKMIRRKRFVIPLGYTFRDVRSAPFINVQRFKISTQCPAREPLSPRFEFR